LFFAEYIEGVSQGLFPVFILGNKTDIPEPDRVITTKQAEDFVASLGLPSVKYAETSAKDGSKVTETFEQIAGAVSKVMINPMYHR
jgi:GTPase SAR1 family protein